MALEARELEGRNRISRRRFMQAVGTVAGTAAFAPNATAQAPSGRPAEPPSTVTSPPRDYSPGAPPVTYVDPDVITVDPVKLSALETVVEGATGVFFDHATPESLAAAMEGVEATPWDPTLMRAHADTVVETAAQRKAAAVEAKASTPQPTRVEPGDIQALADQVIGGKTSDEAIFKTLHGYAKKGGDVKALARVMQQLPAEMRGDLASSFVREIGIAPGTKQFSLDHFANQWNTQRRRAKPSCSATPGRMSPR